MVLRTGCHLHSIPSYSEHLRHFRLGSLLFYTLLTITAPYFYNYNHLHQATPSLWSLSMLLHVVMPYFWIWASITDAEFVLDNRATIVWLVAVWPIQSRPWKRYFSICTSISSGATNDRRLHYTAIIVKILVIFKVILLVINTRSVECTIDE